MSPGKLVITVDNNELEIVFLNLKLKVDRIGGRIETDHHVKETNSRNYLSYNSNHPKHIVKSIVFSQAQTVFMCCSKQDWAERALKELREIFIARDYPTKMDEEQIEKVKKLNRRDLIFKKKEKAKDNKYKTSLIVEHHPENPPFMKWLTEGMKTLHINPALKKLFPKIPIVTRQGKNVGRLAGN